MNTVIHSVAPDYEAIKTRQQATWASGDFGQIGTRLQIVGESLCEAVDLRSTDKVLDVAAGNGNASLAAARRFADGGFDVVLSTYGVMFAPDQRRAAAELVRVTKPGGRGGGRGLVVPADYLEVVIDRA